MGGFIYLGAQSGEKPYRPCALLTTNFNCSATTQVTPDTYRGSTYGFSMHCHVFSYNFHIFPRNVYIPLGFYVPASYEKHWKTTLPGAGRGESCQATVVGIYVSRPGNKNIRGRVARPPSREVTCRPAQKIRCDEKSSLCGDFYTFGKRTSNTIRIVETIHARPSFEWSHGPKRDPPPGQILNEISWKFA